ALASLVVPLLAGAVAAGDRAAVAATTSALLTWTLTLLVPLAALVALTAGPIIGLLAPAGASPELLAAGARMLRVFAPQLPLYGIGIVLTGVLQAHRRFAWPVIAPLLSSVTVIGVYLAFAGTQGRRADLDSVGAAGQLLLAVGTTGGVVVLSLCLLVPLRRLRLRLRPSWTFPDGSRRTVGGLALAGAVTVGSQQVALLVILQLALAGPEGTLVVYNLAQTVYLLPWAVLAVPLATAAYPTLAAAAARGDDPGYRATLGATSRGVLLLSCLGAAALVATARPVADFLIEPGQAAATATGIRAFAPGLLGYGLFAVLSRALYARGRTRAAAAATATGWAAVALAAVLLSAGLADDRRVLALGLANSAGMVLLGVLLTVAVRRGERGGGSDGWLRVAAVGLLAGAVAAVAGALVADGLAAAGGTPTQIGSVIQGMLSGVVVAAVFLAVAYPFDRGDLRPLVGTVRRRLRRSSARARPAGTGGTGPAGDGGKETLSR
ncbi:MAG TPA: lipid II flippase MurJ, partial [Micromonospora sp.]